MSAILSGPMFEPSSNGVYQSIYKKEGAHYNIFAVKGDGMLALKEFFPDAKAGELNFCLFSTSGVHGTYSTIEDAAKHLKNPTEETFADVTFLIVQPRIVCLRYGNCTPQNADDIKFLKKLRASSFKAMLTIGAKP